MILMAGSCDLVPTGGSKHVQLLMHIQCPVACMTSAAAAATRNIAFGIWHMWGSIRGTAQQTGVCLHLNEDAKLQ
jgi:hypothetical protein